MMGWVAEKIESWPIEKLLPYARNSRTHSKAQVAQIAASIVEGSTLIACEKTGRVARLMELDPKFVDVIVRRWQDFTGENAVNEITRKLFNG